MLHLIKLEWSKFSGSNIIRLLTLFFIVFFPAAMYMGKEVPKLPAFIPSQKTFYSFPGVWDYLGYSGNWMVFFFLGVLIIYTVTLEVSHKTMRQSIIHGMTRNAYFTSKLLSVFCLSAFATIYYIIIAVVIGVINSESYTLTSILDNEYAIPRFFLMSFSYLSFAMFIGILFKRSGVAVFVYLTYVMIIEFFIRAFQAWLIGFDYTNIYPMNATEDLMPFPFFKFADFINKVDGPKLILLDYGKAAILTSLYVLSWTGLAYWLFKKRDL